MLQVASSSNCLAHSRSSETSVETGKKGKEGRAGGEEGLVVQSSEDQGAWRLGSGPFCLLPHHLAGDTMAPRARLPQARALPLPLSLPMALAAAQPLELFPQGEKVLLSDSVSASGFNRIL